MTARDFVYWLQGYVEIHGAAPNDEEWQVILDHLKIVDNPEPLILGTPLTFNLVPDGLGAGDRTYCSSIAYTYVTC